MSNEKTSDAAKIDVIQGGKAFGDVASMLLASGMNVNSLRTNATLRKDEWKLYDDAILKAAQNRLVGVADLMSRGLVFDLGGEGMGTTVLEYENQSDIEAADLSMDAITRGRADRPEYDLAYLPLPIIHKDWYINARALAASRKRGTPLDTTMAELAARKVAEKAEEMLFTGASTYTFGGGTIYGYTDFPSRNTVSIGTAWDDSAVTGENILDDIRAMKQSSINDMYYGPWMLYIPTAYETKLDDDYASGYPKSIRQRILEVSGIIGVKVADKLTANNVLLVQMTSDVVRCVQGMKLTTVQWETEGGLQLHYKVMAIWVPQLRADQTGKTGIVHCS